MTAYAHENSVGEIGFSASHHARRPDPHARNSEAAAPAGTKSTTPRSICRSQARRLAAARNIAPRRMPFRISVPRNFAPRFWWQSRRQPSHRTSLCPCSATDRDALLRLGGDSHAREKFDAIVCDFLASAANIPRARKRGAVPAQRGVDHLEAARRTCAHPLASGIFRAQYQRMLRYEGEVCRAAKRIIAVSGADAREMQSLYGVVANCIRAHRRRSSNISLRRATSSARTIWSFSAPWTGGRTSTASNGLSAVFSR